MDSNGNENGLKLALQLLVEVKEKTRDGNTPGYIMNKI